MRNGGRDRRGNSQVGRGGPGGRDRRNDHDRCREVSVTPSLFDNGRVRRQIFTTEGMAIAKCIDTKRSNLRNAYDRLVRLRMDMSINGDDTARLNEGLGELERWAKYQASRKNAPVGRFTERFILDNCQRTKTARDLEGFYQLFQSVIAYLPRDLN